MTRKPASELTRDRHSNAVLSTDTTALNKYKMERQLYRKVDQLSIDVADIQDSLASMCERIAKLENK